MDDLVYIGVFLACCLATVGLIVLSERLMPRRQGDRP
jgi:hypothetical protein